MSNIFLSRYTQKRVQRANKQSYATIKVLRILRMLDKKGLVNKDGKRIKI